MFIATKSFEPRSISGGRAERGVGPYRRRHLSTQFVAIAAATFEESASIAKSKGATIERWTTQRQRQRVPQVEATAKGEPYSALLIVPIWNWNRLRLGVGVKGRSDEGECQTRRLISYLVDLINGTGNRARPGDNGSDRHRSARQLFLQIYDKDSHRVGWPQSTLLHSAGWCEHGITRDPQTCMVRPVSFSALLIPTSQFRHALSA